MAKRSRHTSKGIWRNTRHILVWLMTALQCAAVGMLLLCAASVYVSPARCSWTSVLGLGFPVVVGSCVVVGLLSLIFTPKRTWISLLGILLCCGSLRNYCPVNLPHDIPEDAYHIMTWNIGGVSWEDSSRNALKAYLCVAQPHLLCIQEINSARSDTLAQTLRHILPYSNYSGRNNEETGVMILSRWPIIHVDTIMGTGAHRAQHYTLLMAPGDTLHVVNVHLQSMHLDADVRTDYSAIVKGQQTNRDTMRTTSRTLLQQVRENGIIRAHQTDSVVQYLSQLSGKKIIICGDFNDTPISYTRQQIIKSAPLTDCWRAAGNGIGRTFNRDAIYVRIDHIFCSEAHFKPYGARIDHTRLSDHYPVDVYLRPRQ